MSTYQARKNAAQRFRISSNKLLATSALTAAGLLALGVGQANAGEGPVGANDVIILENTTPDVLETGYSEYSSGDILIDNAIQEDVGVDGQTHFNARMTVITGVESGQTKWYGKVTASGDLLWYDVDGILFGENSKVDVVGNASFTGGSLTDMYFDGGDAQFKAAISEGAEIVIEEGAMISVGEAGLAAFVAPHISNSGIISAKMGTVALAAGETVTLDLYGDGLVEVTVEGELADALIENKGTIAAEGGRVQMTALAAKDAVDNIINTSGIVTVASATQQGGKIILSGGSKGKVAVSGTLDATGTTGGDIEVTGEYVSADSGSLIDASGTNGGGAIRFGGDYQGGGDTPTSDYAYVDQNAIFRSDAIEEGDGGSVIVWADQNTGYYGHISATGGTNSGDGGFVETSAGDYLEALGTVDASAANGAGGEWLLDPRNLTVDAFDSRVQSFFQGGVRIIRPTTSGDGGNTSFVNVANINASLNIGTSVTLRTRNHDNGDGDITINRAINKTAGGNATFRAEAHDDVIVNRNITSTANALNVELIAGALGNESGDHNVNINADITTNGGNLLATGHNVSLGGGDDIRTGGGNVTFIAIEDINIDDDIRTGGGNATFTAGDEFNVDNSNDTIDTTGSAGDVMITANSFDLGGTINAGDANVTIKRASDGDISLGAANGGMHIDQGEISRIDAGTLTVGGDNTQELNVEDVDTTSSTITGLVTLITDDNSGSDDDVNFFGINVFNALSVTADDDIVFDDGAKVETLTGDASFFGDGNGGTVGDLIMGETSTLDTNGNNVVVSSLNVLLKDDAEIKTEGGNVSITARDDFAADDGNVTLEGDAEIDADGGNILIDNEGVFTGGEDSLITNTAGMITVNQNRGTAGGASLQNVIDAMDNTGTGQNTIFSDDSTYNENLTINQANLKIDGDNTEIIGNGVDPTISVEESNFNLDPVIVDAGGAAYGLVATGIGADGLVVDGNTFRNSTEAGIYVARTAATTGTIKNNTFEGSSTRGVETGTLGGGYTLNITDNTIGTDGDEVLNGLLFGRINTATVNISGGTIDAGGGSGSIDGDGINFTKGLHSGADVNISGITIVSDGDEAIDVHQTVRSGSTFDIAGGSYTGGNNGIEFSSTIAGEARIDNATIIGQGADKRGVNLLGSIKNLLKITDSTITGGDDGIGSNDNQNNHVDGGTFEVTGSTITGTNGDGIELGEVKNGATVKINDNTKIEGLGDDGVDITGNVSGASHVEIKDNHNITGGSSNGIEFASVQGGSTIDIIGNNDGIHADDNGIFFTTVGGGSTVNIHDNIIEANLDNGVWGSGIWFNRQITNANINIGDGTLNGAASNIISVLPNTDTSDQSDIDGIHFDEGLGTDAKVVIDGNRIGYTAGPLAVSAIPDDGIEVKGAVTGNAIIEITDNRIHAADDGVQFTSTVGGTSTVTIGETPSDADGNIIVAGDNGISFLGHVTGPAIVNINTNDITGGTHGVEFNGINAGATVTIADNIKIEGLSGHGILFDAGSPSVDGSTVTIDGNDAIRGRVDGVRFSDEVKNGSSVTISDNDIRGRDDGVEFTKGIEDSTLLVSENARIEGTNSSGASDAIDFRGLVKNSDVDINDNTMLRGRDDGLQFAGGVSGGTLDITGNDDITGRNGDGIAFLSLVNFGGDGTNAIKNGAVVNIDDNTITGIGPDGDTHNAGGSGDGILVSGRISGGSSLTVTGNTITGHDEGVNINGQIRGDSSVDISGGNTILGTTGSGVETNGVRNSSLNISDNTSIKGGVDGIQVSGQLRNGSTITIDNNDKIEGVNRDGVHVRDNNPGGATVEVTNNSDITAGRDGVRARNVSGVLVDNNTIHDTGRHGVYASNSSGATISGNTITNAGGNGVLVNPSNNVTVANNDIYDAALNGIRIEGGTGHNVYQNHVFHTGLNGISLWQTGQSNVFNNLVLLTGGHGISGEYGNYTNVYGNIVGLTYGDGIHMNHTYFTNIQNNLVGLTYGNGIAVYGGVIPVGYFTNITGNKVALTGENGIKVDGIYGGILPSYTGSEGNGFDYYGPAVNIDGNQVALTGGHGVSVTNSGMTYITYNDVFAAGLAFKDLLSGDNEFLISRKGIGFEWGDGDGIHVDNVHSYYKGYGPDLKVYGNNVSWTGGDGIDARRFGTGYIAHNNVAFSGIDGTFWGWRTIFDQLETLYENKERVLYAGLNSLFGNGNLVHFLKAVIPAPDYVEGSSHDGIHVDDFGQAWIAYNDVSHTADDGISATDGNFVSIYNNYVDLSGYLPNRYGNTEVGEDANGILVRNVGGGIVPTVNTDVTGYGYSTYGADVEIYGNDVANSEDDGIQVERYDDDDDEPRIATRNGGDEHYSTYIAHNVVGHVGDDGVDVDNYDFTIVKENVITLAEDKGITIDGGRYGDYAGVFNNRILLTGNDGIQVENIRYDHEEEFALLGDDDYGYGWAVNVSGNQIAMTGDDGIEVRYSDATKVVRNQIFMAGMGESLEGVIETVNDFANGTFNPFAVNSFFIPSYNDYFNWSWGNGHGINVHHIDGAYYSPNGWAVDVKNNWIKWTGGHGILAEDNDRTRIKNNRIRLSGIEETKFYGAYSMLDLIDNGPFEGEGRRDLWKSEGLNMIDVLESYIGSEEPEEEPEYNDYVTVEHAYFDNYDGIHANNIYGQSLIGLSGGNYLFDLKIVDNNVRFSGDDNIAALYSGRTLIARNRAQDAGISSYEYGNFYYNGGDYYGGDNIFAKGIEADLYPSRRIRPITQNEDGSWNYEPRRNYALIIKDNLARRAADDNIEVVGSAGKFGAQGIAGRCDDCNDNGRYYGVTDRVLIAENTLRDAGYQTDENYKDTAPEEWEGPSGDDGYGHDNIHVRGIFGNRYDNPDQKVGPGGAYGDGQGGFYGYAVDIIDNDARRAADDNIEVIESTSTLILDNRLRDAGYGSGYYYYYDRYEDDGYYYYYTGADQYGADNIHVRNVGGNYEGASNDGNYSGDLFEPYAVVIAENNARRAQDDNIEVVGEGYYDYYYGRYFGGTGRTLIENNFVRRAGKGGSSYWDYYYGDGWGQDNIHVRGVQNVFRLKRPYPDDILTTSISGGPYGYGGYDVQIIGNDAKNAKDDNVEVIANRYGNTNILVERNDLENARDSGIHILAQGPRYGDSDEQTSLVTLIGPGYGEVNSDIFDNNVTNAGEEGLHIDGYGHGDVVLEGNTFLNNPVGARFESGRIDLTGRTNSFIVTPDYELPSGFDYVTGMQFELAGIGDPTILTIVDETLGTTSFSGFINRQVGDAFYVRFEDGAILNEFGEVIVIDGTNANWDGVVPANFGNVLPANVLQAIEDRLFDADDPLLNGRGQIFVGTAQQSIDNVEDFFNQFDPFGAGLSGLNLIITGLPPVNLGQQALGGIQPFAGNPADIEPAAGGEEGTEVANIEPSAGGSDAACWAQVFEGVINGPVNYGFSSDPAAALESAGEGC